MSQNIDPQQAFHRGTSPIFAILSHGRIRYLAHLQPNSEVSARMDELAEKAKEGELTVEELGEYEAYIEANNLLAVLQAESPIPVDTLRNLMDGSSRSSILS